MSGHCSLGSGDWQTLRRAFSMRFGGEGFEHGPRRSERLIETASTGVPRGPPPPRPTSTPTTSPSTYRVRREVYTLYTGYTSPRPRPFTSESAGSRAAPPAVATYSAGGSTIV